MRKKNKVLLFQAIISIFTLIFLCEYLIHHIFMLEVHIKCFWPELKEENIDHSIFIETEESKEAVKALFFADTHLKRTYWPFEVRREWQMYKAIHTAISQFEPEVVFVLGDLFNGGNNDDFRYYVKRLKSLFQVKENTKVYFVAGNHDIGFHYEITKPGHKRFVKGLKAPSVYQVSIRGNYFVLINSMAMEGDGCFLCRPAQLELFRIAKKLSCAKGVGKCTLSPSHTQYSRPILLQHFPMYRKSDTFCFEFDEAPAELKEKNFKEGYDCLSREISEKIYDLLNPRVIMGGHTHHGCHVIHREDIHEYTLPSLNWRLKNNPSFLMGVFLPNNYATKRCYIPQESTVKLLYCIGLTIIFIFVIFSLKMTKAFYRLF